MGKRIERYTINLLILTSLLIIGILWASLYWLPYTNSKVAVMIYENRILGYLESLYSSHGLAPLVFVLITIFDVRYIIKYTKSKGERNFFASLDKKSVLNLILSLFSVFVHMRTIKEIFDLLLSV